MTLSYELVVLSMKSRSFGCSFELGLPWFYCFCKPCILTEVTISSLHLHKLWNAHLPEKRMNDLLGKLETDTGYRVKVLCQAYPRTPG